MTQNQKALPKTGYRADLEGVSEWAGSQRQSTTRLMHGPKAGCEAELVDRAGRSTPVLL